MERLTPGMRTDNKPHPQSASNKSLSNKPPFTSHKGAVGTDDKTVSILGGYLATGRIPRLHPNFIKGIIQLDFSRIKTNTGI